MSWRMTYNNVDGAACSARGLARAKSKEELEALAKELEKTIYNVKIEKIKNHERTIVD